MRRNLLFLIVPLFCPALLMAQAESEPNDSFAQANTLTLGTARSGDIGGAPCGSGTSDDYYVLNLTQDGSISINTHVTDANGGPGGLRVYVYNSGGGQIFSTDRTAGYMGNDTSITTTHTCLGKGTYYLVPGRLSGDCYTYSLTVTQIAPVYADDAEPNNSFSDASTNPLLAANAITSGHVNFSYQGSDNDDRYRILPADDGTVNLTISAESPNAATTARVYVYNSGGGQIASFDGAVGANSVPVTTNASFTCYGQDYYYLAVVSLGGCGISYHLSYTLTAPFYANDAEPNNSFPTALPLAHNTFTEGHLNFSNAGDNDDRYVINTPAEGTITVTMLAESAAGGTVRVYLFNSGGGQIDSYDATIGSGNTPATTSASFDCYGQGQYYMLVSSIGGCGLSYRMKYQTTGAVYANDAEPNNSLAQALAGPVLAPNTFTEGHINFNHYGDNNDFYFVQTPAEGTMNLTMIAERVPAAAGTLRIYVYNSGGGQINSFDASAGGSNDDDTTTFSFDCYGQGDYYLGVVSIGGCGISYKLKYTTTGAVYANDVEPNNSLAEALTNPLLAPNVYTEGHINFSHYGDNNDFYAIQTADDGTLNLSLIAERVPPADGTVRVYVYNNGGGQIASFDAVAGGSNDDDTTSASFTCYGQSTYYLGVVSIGGCGISYKLGYTLTPPVYANDVEPANTLGTAILLNPDSANASGHLNFANVGDNNDYYRLNLPGIGNISFDFLAESAAGGTVRIYLYNSGGGQINSQDVPVGAGQTPVSTPVAFNALPAGTYYIGVVSIGGCGISYRFNCNDADGDGTCNYFDLCPGGPEPGTACNDNSACTINDVIQANCICAGTFQDADGDGICDVNDNCPNTPGVVGSSCDDGDLCTVNDVLQANCTCAGTFQDTDGDGICDASDNCPSLSGVQGDACNDGNANTINDVINANCVCAGTLLGSDCNGVPGGPAVPGTSCNDNNACTINDIWSNACVCSGTIQDTDGDGTCDANDGCPSDPNKIAPGICGCAIADTDSDGDGIANCNDNCPNVSGQQGSACNDNNACTINDVLGANCVCAGTVQDTDGDGVCNAQDNCPNVTGQVGSSCNDGNACTINDALNASCQCVGTLQDSDGDGICDASDNCPDNPGQVGSPCNDGDANTVNDVLDANCVCMGTTNGGCTQNLTLSIKLDGNPGQTTWKLYNSTETAVVLQGGPFAANQANTTVNVPICVVQGCYHLRVLDSGGNGISGGGYVLRDASSRRIIDASLGSFTAVSEIDNGPNNRAFCVPLTNLGLQTATSCDLTRPRTSPIYCNTQAGATGYQFWIFDPHGTYNRRVLKSTNSLTPSSLVTSPVPCNKDLNVRARALVGLAYREFGAACRIRFTGCAAANNAHGDQRDEEVATEEIGTSLMLFPNPSHDGHVVLAMDNIEMQDGATAVIEVFDVTGQLVHAESAVMVEDLLQHELDLSGKAGTGIYLVTVTIGDQRYMQRLVME